MKKLTLKLKRTTRAPKTEAPSIPSLEETKEEREARRLVKAAVFIRRLQRLGWEKRKLARL